MNAKDYSPIGRYSSKCKYCWNGKPHSLFRHKKEMRDYSNMEKRQRRYENKPRGTLG